MGKNDTTKKDGAPEEQAASGEQTPPQVPNNRIISIVAVMRLFPIELAIPILPILINAFIKCYLKTPFGLAYFDIGTFSFTISIYSFSFLKKIYEMAKNTDKNFGEILYMVFGIIFIVLYCVSVIDDTMLSNYISQFIKGYVSQAKYSPPETNKPLLFAITTVLGVCCIVSAEKYRRAYKI